MVGRVDDFALLFGYCSCSGGGGSFFLEFFLFETRFRNREEKSALEAVLLAMLAYRWFCIGDDVAPVEWVKQGEKRGKKHGELHGRA